MNERMFIPPRGPASRERVKEMVQRFSDRVDDQIRREAETKRGAKDNLADMHEQRFGPERDAVPLKRRLKLEPYQPIASDFADGATQED